MYTNMAISNKIAFSGQNQIKTSVEALRTMPVAAEKIFYSGNLDESNLGVIVDPVTTSPEIRLLSEIPGNQQSVSLSTLTGYYMINPIERPRPSRIKDLQPEQKNKLLADTQANIQEHNLPELAEVYKAHPWGVVEVNANNSQNLVITSNSGLKKDELGYYR